jgi:pantoate--beta-alanine ligase
MILFKQRTHLHDFLVRKRNEGMRIGFVPTMGALHAGHLSLIRKSKEQNELTVCSIYVNPAQFNDLKDLEKYPRPIEKDIELLASVDCDILFLPSTIEIYPDGLDKLESFDLGHLENFLEGASRPGHFNGVANVMYRFLQIVQPDRLYLGQKDFQQVKVIERVIKVGSRMSEVLSRRTEIPAQRSSDAESSRSTEAGTKKSEIQNPIPSARDEIIMCPIVREEDGLAMSSRNIRLTSSQRKNAKGISKELFFIRDHWQEFEVASLRQNAIYRLNSIPEAQVDYLEFCDAVSFTAIDDWKEGEHIICVTAVKVGEVRLLDNVIVK